MIYREEVFSYVKEKFDTVPDYPWIKYPDYAVLRHHRDGKWYGLIMNVSRGKLGLSREGRVDILNVKVHPEFTSLLRSRQGILPAYHMNKEHWITIILDSPFPKNEVFDLINSSYDITR